ncbi:hypothetical protein PRIPAC_77390 [Pristionchus pacificus]|uniref:Uncharacterized protein n=1 Tax=Pristionchus pacificus TaxID=54126 RepID=A0A2A6CJA4_PRIPA|nr:hypothetical protein PRIPAC_77390 [Pristionchus pacificus]|eukprot:PDM78190.1 hypothetical protein PRIPAC_30769 [Pristionchus pacificus]
MFPAYEQIIIKCADPIISPTTVTCLVATATMHFVNPAVLTSGFAPPLICKGTEWALADGQTLLALFGAASGAVSCYD